MSDIKFKATVDSKKGEVSLKNLDKGVDKVGKSTKKAASGFDKLAIKVAGGVAAFALASKALRGLIQWTKEAIKLSAEQEAVEKKLEAVLKSTSEAAGLTKKELLEMASALQEVTTYGDETIIGAQSLLLTFTKIGKDVFPAALEIIMDMSTALGTDLKQGAISVGKALNDPILGVSALSRVGVSFTEQQKEQIKTLVETGDVLSAQNIILKELRVEFGGMSRAAVDTYTGAVEQMKNVYGDLQEKIGDAVTQNEDFRDTIKTITELTKDLIDSGLVEWLTDVATEAILSMPMLKSLAFSLGAILLIYKIQAEKKKKLDEITVEWFKHLELEDDLQIKLRGDIAAVIEVTEEQAEVTEDVVTQIEKLSMIKIDWEALKPPSELLAEWEALFALVETPELNLAWEQFIASQEEGHQNMQLWMSETLGVWTESSQKQWEILNLTKKELAELSDFEQMALAEMSAGYENFIGTILSVLEKWAIGEIVKSVMKLPFPLNLFATAGAIAAVKAIFAGIKGMEKGGWVGLQGPEIVKVGERGPEYVTPNRMLGPLGPARRVEATFTANFFITSPDTMGWQRITREKIGPEFLEWIRLNKSEMLKALEE